MRPNDSLAQINLNVTSFVANPAPTPGDPFCAIALPTIPIDPAANTPMDADGSVTLDADDRTLIRVNRTRHGNSPVTLVFSVGPGSAFSPKQIVFTQSNGADDSDGDRNFKSRNPSGQTISVKNHWVSHGKRRGTGGKTEAPRWKYFIQIQNSAGDFGWIDPGIENAD